MIGIAYQIHASAPSSWLSTSAGYTVKSFMMITVSLVWLASATGRARRERTMIDVKAGARKHWRRISEPMKPVAPARMSFILGESQKWCWKARRTDDISAAVLT
jgi:hypothetical protein